MLPMIYFVLKNNYLQNLKLTTCWNYHFESMFSSPRFLQLCVGGCRSLFVNSRSIINGLLVQCDHLPMIAQFQNIQICVEFLLSKTKLFVWADLKFQGRILMQFFNQRKGVSINFYVFRCHATATYPEKNSVRCH